MAHDSNIMGRNIKMKVSATLSAKKLLSDLKEVHGDDLLFHQSGGVAMVALRCVFLLKSIWLEIVTLN